MTKWGIVVHDAARSTEPRGFAIARVDTSTPPILETLVIGDNVQ